jgi:hypothetical protein
MLGAALLLRWVLSTRVLWPACRLLVTAGILLAGTLTSPGLTNKVLIIGIDGTMCSALAVARTPNLDALKSNGCYTVRAVTHPVTHSAACWSSMFTGVWGDKHLVNDPGNSFTGNNLAGYPSFFKRLEAANSSLNTLCFARWSPLVTVVPDADVKLSFGTDADITAETCRRLTNSNPDVFYMILLDVDSAGHSYGWGPNVTNYVKAIETADGRVGQIISALRSRPTYTNENWLVIAMTDHGEHDHPDLERSRLTWHIVSGPSAARGEIWPAPAIVDMCPTVLTHMGVPIDPAWNLDGRVEGLPLQAIRYGSNLICNGDAEATSGTSYYSTNRGIAWWFDTASTTLGIYGGNARFPSAGSPGPVNRGSNFFLGGTTNGLITQRIDISALGRDIDDQVVSYSLAGWFGGAEGEDDRMGLTARFLDSAGSGLGSNTVGNVTALDRGETTGLLQREAAGTLPVNTRFVEFILSGQTAAGNSDASADNLSFVLSTKPGLPLSISMPYHSTEGWSVDVPASLTNRLYVLERSSDLVAWSEVGAPAPGTGASLALTDTNAPFTSGFYRVRCQRP